MMMLISLLACPRGVVGAGEPPLDLKLTGSKAAIARNSEKDDFGASIHPEMVFQ